MALIPPVPVRGGTQRALRIDLHLHSHVSDGQLSPGELVAAAAKGRLDVIALTDHDTAAGVPEARRAAEAAGIQLIPGIEISSRLDPHEFHILGYWIDPASDLILAHQESAISRRVRRMEKMVVRLQEMGIDISFEEVVAAAGPETHALGRPHLARALLNAGHIRYHGEAFVRFIGDNGPAFVAENFPTPAEAIASIHGAGGLAVWAHPPLDLFTAMLPKFREWGVDGVECYRPNLTGADIQLLEHTARQFGLLTTGGSDWHGPHRAALGDFSLRFQDAAGLLAYGGISERTD
jgi:3',5'-nucleoside bisphosphate phosphatase